MKHDQEKTQNHDKTKPTAGKSHDHEKSKPSTGKDHGKMNDKKMGKSSK